MPFGTNNAVQDPTDWVRVDTAYGESYTSAALNRKLAGCLSTGIMWGFEVVPASGMHVKIYTGDAPEYPRNVAVTERNGYSLTGTSEGELLVPVTAGLQALLVVEMDYGHQLTRSAVRLVETAAEHHVILARLDVPRGATSIRSDYIDYGPRQENNPALLAAQVARGAVAAERRSLEFSGRLARLEQN